jgi:hypothetical protein
MEANHVIEHIETAFPSAPLPGMTLHQAQLADQSMSRAISDKEWNDAGKIDAGRTWQDVTDEEVVACDAALAHFDEESFIYYLPAFLIFALRHCDVVWPHPAWDTVGNVVFFVTHREPSMLGRYKRLSASQRQAVICFLEFIAEHGRGSNAPDAQKALKRHWKTDEATKPLIVVPK